MTNASRLATIAGLAIGLGFHAHARAGGAQPAAQPTGAPPAAQPATTPATTPPATEPTTPAAPPITPTRAQIGTSSHGAPIEVWTLATPGNDAHGRGPDDRPAILVIAGLQGHHTVGVRTAESVARTLAERHADLLADRTVYVISNANPDGDKWITGDGTPRIESGRIPAPGDADRDGRADEDPAEDLNGDGIITQMRIQNPDAHWGLRANLVPNPDEPRLMREAKPTDSEVGTWAVMMEGADNDGDGRFNEDGGGGASGGIDLGMNFPTHYPEHDDGAGRYPLSAPEALALVKWVQARNNIVAVVVYDPHDNLVNVPATGQYGPEGSVPRGLEEADKPYHQHVADAFKEVTRMSGAPTGRTAGTFASWAYGDFGVWTFSTPVWVRPDQLKSDQPERGGGEEGGEGGGAAGADPKAAERERLIAEGFPARVADFLVATPAERQAIMQQAESMTEAERAAMMAEVMALTPAQQQRVMEAVGVRGGRPPGGGPPPAGGPPAHSHDDGEEEAPSDAPASAGFELQTIAQPAGGGGGRRFGGQPGGGPPGGGGGGPPGAGRSEGAASGGDEGKWLTYSDNDRNHEGFIEWTPFEHPQLGPVEIGGFVPGFRVNPPESELERLAAEQTAFLVKLLPMLPDVSLDMVEAERVGGDLWRVRARVSNPGYLPTASAIGQKARRVTPIVVQVSTEPTRVLTGQRVRRFESIDGSGGVRDCEWLIQAPAGEVVTVEVRSDVFGTRTQSVTLSTREAGR